MNVRERRFQTVARCTVLSGLIVALAADPASARQDVTRAEVGAWLEASREATPDFAPGDVITPAELERVRPFVAPGYLEELNFPEFRMEIAETGDYAPHPLYREATLQHAGQTRLGEDGALIDYVAGQPFPNEALDAAAPDRAGLMAAWNLNHRWQHYGQHVLTAHTLFLQERDGQGGTDFSEFPPQMVSGGAAMERSVSVGWRRTYMSHLPQLADSDYRFSFATAEGATYKEITEYYAPFELRGQKLMVERSTDPHEDDTMNAYLPGERKVRRLSARERSDTWIGSEQTFDDFYGFDGHVLDNTWTYLGRHKLLVVMNTKHPYAHHVGPHSRVPDDRWELREAIVLEGVPTLPDHPYGSRLLFVDAQNYQMLTALFFDPNGKLLRGAFPVYSWSETTQDHPEENRGAHVSMYKGYAVINFQTGNATLTNVVETTYPVAKAAKVRRLYRVDNLTAGR